MLIIERLWRDAKAVPPVVRIGVIALIASGQADIVLHAVTPEVTGHDVHTPLELAAHVAGLVSMVVILVGVVTDGARRTSYRRRSGDGDPKGVS